MHLTQGQLELMAQVAPVFLLIFVVERRALSRVPSQAEKLLGRTELVRLMNTSMETTSELYVTLLTGVTLAAFFASNGNDGVHGWVAALIAVPFTAGVVIAAASSLLLIQYADMDD